MNGAPPLRLHGDMYASAGMIDFSVNVGRERPPALTRALERALADRRYPDDGQARAALAAHHGVESAQVLTLNGAAEAFWLLALTLRPRRATTVHPSFSEGELALRAGGARVEPVILRPPEWALADVAGDIGSGFVVVTNPSSPTGRLERAGEIATLATGGRLLLVDESFIDFADGDETLAGRFDLPGLIVLRSCTKLLSLAGIRAGYLLATEELTAQLAAHRQPWPLNALACAALVYYATEREQVGELAATARRERQDLERRLASLPGVSVFPSETNFVLVKTARADVPEQLHACRIAVRPAADFVGLDRTYFRAAARTPQENALLASALELILADA